MTNLIETPVYEAGIYQLETTDPYLGGLPAIVSGTPVTGWANAQALQLANRTNYLNQQLIDIANSASNTKGAAKVGWDGEQLGEQLDLSKRLSDYTALRNYGGSATIVKITNFLTSGEFYLDLADVTSADNGGTTLIDALGRRWKRRADGKINATWFGADPTGQVDCSVTFINAWQAYREILNTPSAHADENNTPCIFTATPGEYLILNSIDLGELVSFSAVIDFTGCVFLANCTGKVAIDALGLRGETWNGGQIIGHSVNTPLIGLLRGPIEDQAIGNSSVNQLKITGYFSLANCLNIGHETTTWNDCYFVNYHDSLNSWCYAGDSYNRLGAISDFHDIRTSLVWASMTSNSFYGCRFFKGGLTGGSPVYLEGSFGWYFDPSCYFVSFGNYGIVARQTGSSYVNLNLEVHGLFETFVSFDNSSGVNDPSKGIQSCIRILAENGQDRIFKQLIINAGQVQCGKSVIDVVDVTTLLPLTSGSLTISAGDVSVSGTVNRNFTVPLFTGNFVRFSGGIAIGSTGQVSFDISVLRYFAGTLKTTSVLNVTEPTTFVNYSYLWTKYDSGPVIRGDLTLGEIKRALDINMGDQGVVSTRTISAFTSGNTLSDCQIQCLGGTASQNQGTMRLQAAAVSTSLVRPNTDNLHTLGAPTFRWSTVYAATGTINTSDERSKQQIQQIDEAAIRAWANVEYMQYRFDDAVALKGDGARWHFGVIAQRVKDAFDAEGLDAFAYGLLCYDEWPEQFEMLDAEGNVVQPYIEAGNRYGIRYEEALALECAYLRSQLRLIR